MIRFILLLFTFSLSSTIVFAQKKGIEISGKVIEGASQQPIEFATILVGDKETKDPITGATTDMDGNFELRTSAKNFFLEISFIGYASKVMNEFDIQNGKLDLGTIVLLENSEMLDEVLCVPKNPPLNLS